MSDLISPEVFIHLVQLAALELTPAEAEYLLEQMNNRLKAIDELEAVSLEEDSPVTTHGAPGTSIPAGFDRDGLPLCHAYCAARLRLTIATGGW